MKYLINTNILIDHLRGDAKATQLLQDVEDGVIRAAISVINEYELLSGLKISPAEEKKINELLLILPSIGITLPTVRTAARFRRAYNTDIVDALIAATAANAKAILVTRNIKHFKNIKELSIKTLPFK